MMEKAELEARQIIEELQEAVKDIEQNHRDLENHRQNVLSELKNLSVDLIEKVERTARERKEFRFEDYVKRVKELARESGERIRSEDTHLKIPKTEPAKTAASKPVTTPSASKNKTKEETRGVVKEVTKEKSPNQEKPGPRISRTVSFFDELDKSE